MEIKHTESFDLAYRFVTETNLNIFLTGKAGTGKTTFLKYLRQHSYKKMVVAAPTGVAAINAGGVTLHSLFQLPFAPFVPSKEAGAGGINSHSLLSQIRFNRDKLNLLRNLELLVIDEVSMVASHTIDAIDAILRSVKRRHQLPFGGTQVLFIGDLHQLPPVVKNQEWAFLKNYYPSIFFFDSLVLREHVPIMIELKEIFRQQDNTFISVLNDIRNNELTQDSYDTLHTRLKKGFDPPEEEGYITLTTHNSQSDEINRAKLKKLFGYTRTYKAQIHGDFPESMYPAEAELELKEGAQVMFLKNDVEGKKYFNGKIGVITALYESSIRIKCKGEAEDIEVKLDEWKNVNYSLNEATHEITEIELGSFIQYPLRLAWAITIHKSQGLTFDKLIIDAENAFANGQVYVALSRCTSLEGLVLTSPINQKFLGAYHNLKEWEDKHKNERSLPFKFEESRQAYIQQELQSVFTWSNWAYKLGVLNHVLTEHKDAIPAACLVWIYELIEKQKALDGVAKRFREQMTDMYMQGSIVEENEQLQGRIKDASSYFVTEIRQWLEKFSAHQLTTDTKKTARKIDDSLNEVNFEVHEILFRVEHCKNGFMLNDYLQNWKKFGGIVAKMPGSYALNQAKSISSKETEHAVLYGRIAEMRNRIGKKNNLPLYTVFSNAAIKNVCQHLPLSYEALLKVKGFGKVKVKKYGDEVLDLVKDYCAENNLKPVQPVAEKIRVEKKPNTVEETIRLYKSGKTIEEIALERNFVTSTIEGHLAKGIEEGSIQINSIMPMEEVEEIAKHFPLTGDEIKLADIKGSFADDISFGRLKMVQAWLQMEKKIKAE